MSLSSLCVQIHRPDSKFSMLAVGESRSFSFPCCCSVQTAAKTCSQCQAQRRDDCSNFDCFLAVSAGQCNFWHKSAARQIRPFFSRPPYNLIKVPAWSIITIVSILSVYTNNKALSHFLFSLSDFSHLRDGGSGVALCCHGGELQTVIFQVLELWCVREFQSTLSCFLFLAICGSEFCPV